MNTNKLKIAASIAGLCVLGCLKAKAGDLTVDNLTVNTNATIKGMVLGNLTIQSNLFVNGPVGVEVASQLHVGNQPWWAYLYPFLCSGSGVEVEARVNNDTGDAILDITASQDGEGDASPLVRFGGNALWVGTVGFDGQDGYKFKIDTYPAAHVGEETALTIDTSKNVGIGTTEPEEKLHVDGNVKVTNGQFIGNGSGLLISPQGDLSMGTFTAGTPP